MEKKQVAKKGSTPTPGKQATKETGKTDNGKTVPKKAAVQERKKKVEEVVYSDEDFDSEDDSEYDSDSEESDYDPIEYMESRRKFMLENSLGFNVGDSVLVRENDDDAGVKGKVAKILNRRTGTASGWLVMVKTDSGEVIYPDSDDCFPLN